METEIKMLYIIEALIIYDIMKFLIGLTISLLMPQKPTIEFSKGQLMSLEEFEKEMKKIDKENKDE
tara:strand:+ start:401 stop:598 length:198 start_codon:yes stop_codon:yes gene_type:complete